MENIDSKYDIDVLPLIVSRLKYLKLRMVINRLIMT